MLFRPLSDYFKLKINKKFVYYSFYCSLVDTAFILLGCIVKGFIWYIPFYIYRQFREGHSFKSNNPKFLGDDIYHTKSVMIPPIFIPHPYHECKEYEDYVKLQTEIFRDGFGMYGFSRLYYNLDPNRESDHILFEGYKLDEARRNMEEEYFLVGRNLETELKIDGKSLKNMKESTEFKRIAKYLNGVDYFPNYFN